MLINYVLFYETNYLLLLQNNYCNGYFNIIHNPLGIINKNPLKKKNK